MEFVAKVRYSTLVCKLPAQGGKALGGCLSFVKALQGFGVLFAKV